MRMSDTPYNRWQGLAIAQFSVAVALISGLSIAGLGAGLSLLQSQTFVPAAWWRCTFALSQVLFIIAAFLSCAAVIIRTLDFRLTAREARKSQKPNYDKSLKIFGLASDDYSRATWRLFWPSCISLALGAVLFVVSVAVAYADRLY
jgi:hypothetical protein